MSLLPSDSAFADGAAVSKSLVRALFSQRVPMSLANAAELRALTTGAANDFLLRALNQFWFCDPADTTSADDGVTVIVSADGYRYKPIVPSVADGSITAAKLAAGAAGTAQLADGGVTFAKLAGSAIASDGDAQAGTATNKLMTPETVAAAIAAQVSGEKIVGTPQTVNTPVSDVRFAFPALATPLSYRLFRIHYWNLLSTVSDCQLCARFSSDNGATFFSGASDYNILVGTFQAAFSLLAFNQMAGAGVGATSGQEAEGEIEVFDPLTNGVRKAVYSRQSRVTPAGLFGTESAGGHLQVSTSTMNMLRLFLRDSGGVEHNIAKGVFVMTGLYF